MRKETSRNRNNSSPGCPEPTNSPKDRALVSRRILGGCLLLAAFGVAAASPGRKVDPDKAPPPISSGLAVAPFFSDNMVLQAECPGSSAVVIWGWADEGDKVRVHFRHRNHPGFSATHVGKNRTWQISFGDLQEGGPDTLEVIATKKNTKQTQRVILTNVVVGNVWVAGTFPSTNCPKAGPLSSQGVTEAELANLRFLHLNRWSGERRDETPGGWSQGAVEASTLPGYSSTALYFGCQVMKTGPTKFIGIIEVPWEEVDALVQSRTGRAINPQQLKLVSDASYEAWRQARRDFDQALDLYNDLCQKAQKRGEVYGGPKPDSPRYLKNSYRGNLPPTDGLAPYAISGALWWKPFSE